MLSQDELLNRARNIRLELTGDPERCVECEELESHLATFERAVRLHYGDEMTPTLEEYIKNVEEGPYLYRERLRLGGRQAA